ncbi:MAG TPA: hypothetical protein PLE68_01045, partial [Bacillota bacterium]|nr:hypothetical protein [Bacillota bacterium]
GVGYYQRFAVAEPKIGTGSTPKGTDRCRSSNRSAWVCEFAERGSMSVQAKIVMGGPTWSGG